MSFFKSKDKGQEITETVEQARQAHAEGRKVFVSRLRIDYSGSGASSSPEAADLIEGIEREGWALSHVSESVYADSVTQMTCIFRRGQS
ncbi:hypothetical protein [Streptosporangium sp. NPDC000509]|uniref:hypothetical protein n=1 Tax=Streptosporangium sp. NPDC000509 TaxID=3366186 RepID=UPI0036B462A0